jgi:hypothetical protein
MVGTSRPRKLITPLIAGRASGSGATRDHAKHAGNALDRQRMLSPIQTKHEKSKIVEPISSSLRTREGQYIVAHWSRPCRSFGRKIPIRGSPGTRGTFTLPEGACAAPCLPQLHTGYRHEQAPLKADSTPTPTPAA